MPVPAANNTRSGGLSLLDAARVLCAINARLGPTMRERWADRPAFLAVCDAADIVCSLLPAAFSEQATMDAYTGTFDPSDGTLIPGQTAP